MSLGFTLFRLKNMLLNQLVIVCRFLWKNKGISIINTIGLSAGLACFTLVFLDVLNEYNFDRFHAKSERLFAVYEAIGEISNQPAQKQLYLPVPLGPALKSDIPDVDRFARFQNAGNGLLIRTPNGIVEEEEAYYTDPTFFEMFSFPFLYGNKSSALATVNHLVLTERMAHKLFGESNPIGKTLELNIAGTDNFEPFMVSAVLQDLPSNSTLQFDLLLSFEKWIASDPGRASQTNWQQLSTQTFVELRQGSGLPKDPGRMYPFFLKYYPDVENILRSNGLWSKSGPPVHFAFLPIRSLHHDPDLGINPWLSLILMAIGGIILLLAGINFITLSIGSSVNRAREIGVRKVLGASRGQLSRQYLVETIVLSSLSTGAGIGLASILLPVFNRLSGKNLVFDFSQFPELFWFFPGLALMVGTLAGSYPAFALSGYSPVDTLKNKLKIGGENGFTKMLVTLQFVLSVGLMTCTFIMLRQMDFLRSKDLGFDQENIVVVNAGSVADPISTLSRVRQSLANRPEIESISGAEYSLGAGTLAGNNRFEYKGETKIIFEHFIDQEYLHVLKLPLVSGRNFDSNLGQDSMTSVILNETAVRDFGWTNETAIGQELAGYHPDDPKRNPRIIGIVRDYHFRSLHEKVYPMMFNMFHDRLPRQYFIRIAQGDPAYPLAQIQKAWKIAEPILPFRYAFLDENLQQFYKPEMRMSTTIGWAGGIAIFLACLGLFGLAALSTVNRTREIGIRKVLGASVAGIMGLLTRDFLKLIYLAIIIASPIAYYFMYNWLAGFAFRIKLQWWMFALGGAVAVTIAFLTVGFQSVKAARVNPVESLRNE